MQPSMCKSMAAVTIIQLAMRDVVSADQTYLQEHLSNKAYIVSNECKVIDKFLLAFKNNDLDMLDDAKHGDNLFYFDPEVQPLARNLSLFSARAREAKDSAENAKITKELKILALSTATNADVMAEMAVAEPITEDEDEPDLC